MELFLLANEMIIMKDMEEEFNNGLMGQDMKDIDKMIKRMVKDA